MKAVLVIVPLAALGLAAALGTVLLGLADVAATTPHWKVTRWVLSTTMENAVERRAAALPAPEDLADPVRVRAGAAAYDDMCSVCHAAPGTDAGPIAEGLLPEPPELAEEAEEWTPAELFWITKHGVRMTGMPAFGPSHEDPELWDLVAFLRKLPDLSPAEYRALVDRREAEHGGRRAPQESDEHDHAH